LPMEAYQKKFAELLAECGALFFFEGLVLKDGRPTPYFVNMGRFRTGKLSYLLGTYFADKIVHLNLKADVILGPSYKGSAIACATACALWLNHQREALFEYDRKELKHHGEATASRSLFVNGCLNRDREIIIVDDVGTSMATKYELLEKINQEAVRNGVELKVQGVVLGIDREQTRAVYDEEGNVVLGVKGTDAITDFQAKTELKVYRICGIQEVVNYLFQTKVLISIDGELKPLDQRRMDTFNAYLDMYGTTRSE